VSKKRALGSGLDALLGEDFDLAINGRNSDGVSLIHIDKIRPNPKQPREHFDEETLVELAESIRQQGILQPIIAEERDDGTYTLVAGERRWKAGKLAHLETIPAIVRNFTPEQKMEIALVENIQRDNLTPLEEARAYRHLMDALGLSQQDVADRVGKKRPTVANSLRLLKLPDKMKKAIDMGDISAGHARALLAVMNPPDQELLFNRIIERSLSVRDAEVMANDMNRGYRGAKKERAKAPPRDTELRDIEQRFIETLGTKVLLRGSVYRGRIEISWYDREDLERIYALIVERQTAAAPWAHPGKK